MNPNGKISRLLEPLQVKGVTLRNRIVKPPQVLGFAADDGNASPMLIGHYEAVAKGGVGLLIVESTCVDYPIGGKGENRLRIDEDASIPRPSVYSRHSFVQAGICRRRGTIVNYAK